jgi:hypothetical protein
MGQDGKVRLLVESECGVVLDWQLAMGRTFGRYLLFFVLTFAFPAENLSCAFESTNDDLSC